MWKLKFDDLLDKDINDNLYENIEFDNNIYFPIGAKILNRKTKKIAIILDNNYANCGILKYYFANTPNNVHIELFPYERFDLIN